MIEQTISHINERNKHPGSGAACGDPGETTGCMCESRRERVLYDFYAGKYNCRSHEVIAMCGRRRQTLKSVHTSF